MVRVVGRVRLTHNKHGSDHGLTIFASGSKKSGFGSSQNFLTHFAMSHVALYTMKLSGQWYIQLLPFVNAATEIGLLGIIVK